MPLQAHRGFRDQEDHGLYRSSAKSSFMIALEALFEQRKIMDILKNDYKGQVIIDGVPDDYVAAW